MGIFGGRAYSRAMSARLTLDHMCRLAAERGGACLSTQYVNSATALEWACALGHRWKAVPSSVRQGHWCKQCADARRRFSLAELERLAAARGGKCLAAVYVNSQTRVEWLCADGHRWLAIPNSVRRGSWCAACARTTASRHRTSEGAHCP